MIIDSLLEFTAEQPVVSVKEPGEAIGNELYFNVCGADPLASCKLSTGDAEGSCDTVLISGSADEDGFFSARIPFGVKKFLKGEPVGHSHIGFAPQYSFEKIK